MERFRFTRNCGRVHRDVFGVGPVACHIGHCEYFVAFVEVPRSGRADFFNLAGEIPPRNQRQLVPQPILRVSGPNFPIDRVHARGVHAHEDVARLHWRTRCLFVHEHFRSAVIVHSNRFHCLRFPACLLGDCFESCHTCPTAVRQAGDDAGLKPNHGDAEIGRREWA